MGRIRSIKPEFPQSETIGKLSRDARLLFVQLWTIVDDDGRTRAASRMLASLLYPYDDDAPKLIKSWLSELEREACLIRYEIDGSQYLQLTNWLKHQKIDHPSKSKFPPPPVLSPYPRESSRILAPDMDQDRDREEDQDKEGDQEEETRANALSLAKQSFDQFWDAWPNKVGRPPAERAFAKSFAKHGLETILGGVGRYVRDKPPDRPWLNPATFLNQERFLDSPAPPPEARAGPLTQADVLNELKRKVNRNVEPNQHGLKDVTPGAPESGRCDPVANLFEPNGRKMAGRAMHDLHASSPNARGPVTLEEKAWRTG